MASRGCVCFVGNLPGDVREREIEDLFYKVSLSDLNAMRFLYHPLDLAEGWPWKAVSHLRSYVPFWEWRYESMQPEA